MLLSCFAPWEHAGQADRSDGAPKMAILVPWMHPTDATAMARFSLSGALLASLSSAELAVWPRLAALDAIDESMGDQVWTPRLRQAMLRRHQVR